MNTGRQPEKRFDPIIFRFLPTIITFFNSPVLLICAKINADEKTITLAALVSGAILHFANLDGALPENTLAPGELHCGRAPRHNIPVNAGNAQMDIVFQNGAAGYLPDSTYEITVKVQNTLTTRNGFEILALNSSNLNAGTWLLTEPAKMKIIPGIGHPNRKYITHLAAGNQQSEWNMKWKAPSGNPGNIKFFASVLCANNNGMNTGDEVYNTNKIITQITSPTQEAPLPQGIRIFPNPATTGIWVNIPGEGDKCLFQIFNADKGLVKEITLPDGTATLVPVGDLMAGVYYMGLKNGALQKMVICR